MNISFNELLEAVEQLSLDEQESLIEVIRHRVADHHRQEISTIILSAREEHKTGRCHRRSLFSDCSTIVEFSTRRLSSMCRV